MAEMQAKQELTDPESPLEVMKTLVVDAIIGNKGCLEGWLVLRRRQEVWGKRENVFLKNIQHKLVNTGTI